MISGYQTNILKIYESIREQEKKELKNRKEEIYKKIPEIKKIDKRIADLCIDLSISMLKNLNDRDKYLEELKNKITDLRIKKTELLVSNKYPMDYLEIHYKCNNCKDTGFIGNKKCTCYRKRLVSVYYKTSELKDILMENNFKNFNLDYYSDIKSPIEVQSPKENMEKILNISMNFIRKFHSIDTNLLFYGDSGTGKTFLSHCIAKELLDRGNLVIYKPCKELIEDLRNARFNNNKDLEDILIECDLLIIDDLGTEPITEFSKTELFNLINFKLLKKKNMIISTNFSIEELSRVYSERITSRLFGNFKACKFYGEDIRIKKNY